MRLPMPKSRPACQRSAWTLVHHTTRACLRIREGYRLQGSSATSSSSFFSNGTVVTIEAPREEISATKEEMPRASPLVTVALPVRGKRSNPRRE